ncbi:hypothetical protein M9H77_06355 [Catharanthus roseus]|uniref:Uncharacterized protein n=1 Tax=Catharanthus roseus TaxID=4058 RepID=A0ACC0BRZ3_CATRO|nr:hypothetical protein M9H77_06355 [Catharanthus roseus]
MMAHLLPHNCPPQNLPLLWRDGSSSFGYGSSGLEASSRRFSEFIIFAYKLPSSRTTTHITAVFQEQFNGPYHTGLRSPKLSEICDGESFKTRGRRRLMRATGSRCGIIRVVLRIKPSPSGIRETGLRGGEPGSTRVQNDFTERFSQSKYVEELHKHQKEEKKGEYVDYLLAEFWRLMRRVEDAVSRVSAAFDEHMRRLFEHNYLAIHSISAMMPLIRVAMSADPSISSSTAIVAGTSKVPTRDSSTLPSINALEPITPLLDPSDVAPPYSRDAI